jgi:recombination protein RecA
MPKKTDDKRKKLELIMKEINRDMKEVVLKYASEEPDKVKIPFGVETIDEFVGGGALCGNYIIVYGGEGVGKTTLILKQIASAQKEGKICCYIDLEHGFNKERATALGVNLSELVLIEDINNAEEAMNITVKLAREKVVDYIAIDSIQAMSPTQEQFTKKGKEKGLEDDEMALLARKMGKFTRICATPIYQANIALVLIGQIRTEGLGTFITKSGLTGGHAIKHWSQLTIYMRKGQGADAPTEEIETGKVDKKGKPKKELIRIGFDCVLTIQKTKTNSKPENSSLHIPFYFSSGFDKILLDKS